MRRWLHALPCPLLLSSLQHFVSDSIKRERHAYDTRIIFAAPHNRVVEPKGAIGVLPCNCKSEGGAMRKFSRGIWTCAALYVALGLIGIFFLTSEPSVATSSEGYGIAATASPAPLR
jgi:hypothetical protein